MKNKLALITWSGLLEGTESERLLLPHLSARGIHAEIVDWREEGRDFRKFDLLVLRSCWDYHLREKEFKSWLEQAARATPVLNEAATVLWNSNKLYLRELPAQKIEIADTVFAAGDQQLGDADWARITSWDKVVVKPAVSASAYKTWLFSRNELPTPSELARAMPGQFLLQRFMPEIETNGEISLIYFNGIYSHAILKRPAAGDFRVQKEFGGSAEIFSPPASLLQQADAIAHTVPQVAGSLYCRIDAIDQDGMLVLMELELVEPELFLGLEENAAKRFADAIANRLH